MIQTLPVELILNIMYYCDINSIRKLLLSSLYLKNIIDSNFDHICRNFKHKIDRDFYFLVKEHRSKELKNFLFNNYYLEVRRNLVLENNTSIQRTEYEIRSSELGFFGYKNYKYFIRNGYEGLMAYQASKVIFEKTNRLISAMESKNFEKKLIEQEIKKIEKKQIDLLIVLKKSSYFTESSAIEIITSVVSCRIRNILGLARVGFSHIEIIEICNNLSETKIHTIFNLKDLGFLNHCILNLINNYSPEKINRLITLRNCGCGQLKCITAIENLDLIKLDLLIKVYHVNPNCIWENAYTLVKENSLEYLNDYVNNH